jgi:hypothetical protein
MSYQGFGNFAMPVQTVDEVADYTDMMGQASVANQAGQKPSWRNDATKSLIALWVLVFVIYLGMAILFRRYLV